jgi:hypothetical protein
MGVTARLPQKSGAVIRAAVQALTVALLIEERPHEPQNDTRLIPVACQTSDLVLGQSATQTRL